MIRTKVTQTLAPAGFASPGKPIYANRHERLCVTRNAMEGSRRVVAVAILSVSASWIAFGQTQEASAAQSQAKPTFTVLHAFTGGTDGSGVAGTAPVILDKAGNLYGTTVGGGDVSGCGSLYGGCGVVFQVDPAGMETVLHTFHGGTDGGTPYSDVVRDAAGNLYGTTLYGGVHGYGVVYKLDKAGHEKVLYSFTGGTHGGGVLAGVVRDAAGNLYGTATNGGDLNACPGGCGVEFKVDPTGKELVLHRFGDSPTDGQLPSGANLLADMAGDLYGTTAEGGTFGLGVVFKVDSTGKETVLYSFPGGADGGNPLGLVRDNAGNFYGTTLGITGKVFKIDPSGTETVLYTFTGGTDGGQPSGRLVRDAAGNLYGTTYVGGDLKCPSNNGCGVVFKVDPTGKETVLYNFTGLKDGGFPVAGVASRSATALPPTAAT